MRIFKKTIWMLFAASCLGAASCARVTPTVDERQTASFDGNIPDAGIIERLPDDSLHITSSARDRYNDLVDDFGDQLHPPVKRDFGVTKLDDGSFSITLQGAEAWYSLILVRDRDQVERSDSLWKKIAP